MELEKLLSLFQERRISPFGKQIHRPPLVRKVTGNGWAMGARFLVPVLLNACILVYVTYGPVPIAPPLLALILFGLAAIECLFIGAINRLLLPQYRGVFDTYFRMASPGNALVTARMVFESRESEVNGRTAPMHQGVVTVLISHGDHQERRELRLLDPNGFFLRSTRMNSLKQKQEYCCSYPVQIIYHPRAHEFLGERINGEILDVQPIRHQRPQYPSADDGGIGKSVELEGVSWV